MTRLGGIACALGCFGGVLAGRTIDLGLRVRLGGKARLEAADELRNALFLAGTAKGAAADLGVSLRTLFRWLAICSIPTPNSRRSV